MTDRTAEPAPTTSETVAGQGDPEDAAAGMVGPGRGRRWRRAAGVAAVVAVLVVANAKAAGASTLRKPSKAEVATAAASAVDGPVHGEFRVVNADGTEQVRRWQWGEVVDITDAGLTVASSDGLAGAYELGPGVSVADIAVGDIVTVVGTVQA